MTTNATTRTAGQAYGEQSKRTQELMSKITSTEERCMLVATAYADRVIEMMPPPQRKALKANVQAVRRAFHERGYLRAWEASTVRMPQSDDPCSISGHIVKSCGNCWNVSRLCAKLEDAAKDVAMALSWRKYKAALRRSAHNIDSGLFWDDALELVWSREYDRILAGERKEYKRMMAAIGVAS